MGCTSSILKSLSGDRRKKKKRIPVVVVFALPLRVPVEVDFYRPLMGIVATEIVERLSLLHERIVVLARDNFILAPARISELRKAVEEYLPMVLGLTKIELIPEALVQFRWKSLGEVEQETCLPSVWFELLLSINLMATLSILEANHMLVPDSFSRTSEGSIPEDSRKAVIDLLLRVSGFLDFCIRHMLIHLPYHIRQDLPKDLQEGVFEAISLQALGQAVEMQLGLALESEKATLSVKRRLACEEVVYFSQAHHCLSGCDSNDRYTKKLLLFLHYKYLEAKAAAYYFHGLITGKGNSQDDQIRSICCHLAADEILIGSKKACLNFGLAAPISRVPPPWGSMKLLHEKISGTASKKSQLYSSLSEHIRAALQSLPDLPEFTLSLKPGEFELPELDTAWRAEKWPQPAQCLKEHLEDDDETSTESSRGR